MVDTENTANDNDTVDVPVVEAPSWMWDENTAGAGDRPEWLPEKFKTVADGIKSYNELEKVLGSSPKEYSFEKAGDWLESDHPAMKKMTEFAKSKHVSQDVFDVMLGSTAEYLNEFSVNAEQEKAALGENAEERLELINNWAKSNLSEDSFYALTGNLNTAQSVMAIEEIRNLMIGDNTMIPSSNDSSQSNADSMEDIQSEMNANFDKYKTDTKYRREIASRIEKISKQSGFIDKNGF